MVMVDGSGTRQAMWEAEMDTTFKESDGLGTQEGTAVHSCNSLFYIA